MTQGLGGYGNPYNGVASSGAGVGGGTAYGGGLFGTTVTGPNQAAYNNLLHGSNQAAQTYGATGQNYQQQAAQIQNPYQAASQAALAGTNANLGGIGALLSQTAQGQGPAVQAVQNQMTQATGQNVAAQMAMARSANGGALAQNGAQLGAQGNIASTLGNAASSSAQTLAQQQLAAAQAAGQVYGTQGQLGMNQYQLEQQSSQNQAALQMQAQQGTLQGQLGFGGLAQGASGQALGALNGYNAANLGAEQAAAQSSQNNFNDIMGIGTLGASSVAAGIGSL